MIAIRFFNHSKERKILLHLAEALDDYTHTE